MVPPVCRALIGLAGVEASGRGDLPVEDVFRGAPFADCDFPVAAVN